MEIVEGAEMNYSEDISYCAAREEVNCFRPPLWGLIIRPQYNRHQYRFVKLTRRSTAHSWRSPEWLIPLENNQLIYLRDHQATILGGIRSNPQNSPSLAFNVRQDLRRRLSSSPNRESPRERGLRNRTLTLLDSNDESVTKIVIAIRNPSDVTGEFHAVLWD